MLKEICQIAVEAGKEAMRFYKQPLPVDYKADDSPLTAADRAAHKLICSRLRELQPELPVLSEESDPEEIAGRLNWQQFWLVDPLDGTKEFIKQTGEFTVNIALIVDGAPQVGVVHAPALGLTYFAKKEEGAFKQAGDGSPERIVTRLRPDGGDGEKEGGVRALTIVASRDHAGPMVKRLFERFPQAETRSMGSSLKFCLVAEGAADLYLRDGPTMEWDTGAAQCVVEAAGGVVSDLRGHPLAYNKESLRNPEFVVIGDPALRTIDWTGA